MSANVTKFQFWWCIRNVEKSATVIILHKDTSVTENPCCVYHVQL